MKPSQVDEIFNDDYKPPWLVNQERLIQDSYTYALQAKVNLEYKLNAYETLHRVAVKYSKPRKTTD